MSLSSPKSGLSSPQIADLPPSDWPFRDVSAFLDLDGVRWHFQQLGHGEDLLLIHGTGGSSHSWNHCLAELSTRFRVTAVDLPGHGFTVVTRAADERDNLYSIEGMSRALAALVHRLHLAPTLVAGHSAGVAVLMRMVLDGHVTPRCIVGFNPALVAPPTAYVALIAPLLARIVESRTVADGGAWMARSTPLIRAMLASSGTALAPADLARYELLCGRPAHVHAAIAMMSRWDLPTVIRDAVSLTVPLVLVAGANDRWVPYASLARSVARIPAATLRAVAGAGHLLLEERPDEVIGTLSSIAGHSAT